MLATFNVSSSVLSIGVFFTLMIVGLAGGLPHATQSRPRRARRLPGRRDPHLASAAGRHALRGVPRLQPREDAARAARAPPPLTRERARAHRAGFFPHLISGPFHTALVYAFVFAIVACVVAAVASLLRGGKYVHVEAMAIDPLDVEEAA